MFISGLCVCVCVCAENQLHCRSSPSLSKDTPYKHTHVHTRPIYNIHPNSWQCHTQAFCEQVWYIEPFHQIRRIHAICKAQPTMPQETRSGHSCFPKLPTLLSIWAEAMTPRELCRAPSTQVSGHSRFFQIWKFVAKTACCHFRTLLTVI